MMIERLVPKRVVWGVGWGEGRTGGGTVLIWRPASCELIVEMEPGKPRKADTVHQSTPVC